MVKLGKGVYVSKLAHISGDVTICDDCSIWPGASVRGDRSSIYIGKGSNVQDNATIHSESHSSVVIGENVTIGHNAVVHGATVGDNVIIGMGAIVLDGTTVGAGSIIGAGAVIGGKKTIPERSIVVGNPFKILRQTTDEEVAGNVENARRYVQAGQEYKNKGE